MSVPAGETIAIIDYGSGNIRSVQKAFERVGAKNAVVTSSADIIRSADGVVLPGVGAFRDCMAGLDRAGLVETVKEFAASGKPFLGICVGHQLLFDEGHEFGIQRGLGILPGYVRRFPDSIADNNGRPLKIPHMGWNALNFRRKSPLFAGLDDGYFYFVHSYYAEPADLSVVSAVTDYGMEITAAVTRGNVFGTQFHPEKSDRNGLKVISNFLALARDGVTAG